MSLANHALRRAISALRPARRWLATPEGFVGCVALLVLFVAIWLGQNIRCPGLNGQENPLPTAANTAALSGQSNTPTPPLNPSGSRLGQDASLADGLVRHSHASMVIVMDDLGEDLHTARWLANLPYRVTFAIWPHASHVREIAQTAHAAGREVIIHLPMEPIRYPQQNPGPKALLLNLPEREIQNRVAWSIPRVPFAVGLNNHMGSAFTRNRKDLAALLRLVHKQGLFILDSLTHPSSVLYAEALRMGIPALKRDIFLDAEGGKEEILKQLRQTEKIAFTRGRAIAIGHPLPETLAALKEWGKTRDTRINLVSLTRLLGH